MQEWAKLLHQNLHQKILRFEEKWQAGQIHSRPFFLVSVVACYLFSIIAEGILLDVVLPHLETRWVLKLTLEILGALIFILIFILGYRHKKERGFLFWYPWTMVFIAVVGTIFLHVQQVQIDNGFAQTIATNEAFYEGLLYSNEASYLSELNNRDISLSNDSSFFRKWLGEGLI
jgi:hypothetical protein